MKLVDTHKLSKEELKKHITTIKEQLERLVLSVKKAEELLEKKEGE